MHHWKLHVVEMQFCARPTPRIFPSRVRIVVDLLLKRTVSTVCVRSNFFLHFLIFVVLVSHSISDDHLNLIPVSACTIFVELPAFNQQFQSLLQIVCPLSWTIDSGEQATDICALYTKCEVNYNKMLCERDDKI